MEKTEHKVLVANRGEIAVRIVQACRKLGLEFVCVHTAEDIHSGHVRIAVSYTHLTLPTNREV